MLWLSFLCILICILYSIYKYFRRQFSYWGDLNIPYVSPSIPFGNFKDVITLKICTGQFVQQMYNKTREKVVGVWILWMPYLIIRDPSLINSVLIKDFNYFSHRAVLSEEKCDEICSKMLFFLNNPEWKNVRNKISPHFSSAKLKTMSQLIIEANEDMQNYLFYCRGKNLEAKEISLKFSTDILMSCFFGLKGNSFSQDNAVFYSFSKKIFGISLMNAIRFVVYFFLPNIGRLFKISFVDPNITKFMRRIIWQTISDREISKKDRNDIIDRLIKLRQSNTDVFGDGNGFEDDRVVSIPVQMFIAGIDTTASVLAYALYEVCLNQDIQEKLRNEIINTINAQGLNYESVMDMVYLNKVIYETLRKYPILPYIDRKATADYQLPGTDYIIKKGVPIYIPLLGLHHDPDYYPNPQVFDPERFSKENIAKRTENVYLPFGGGPRLCIGNRFGLLGTKLGLIHILREFRIVKCEKTVPLVFDPRGGLLTAKDGLWMRYEYIKA